jgi:hypothetical protein
MIECKKEEKVVGTVMRDVERGGRGRDRARDRRDYGYQARRSPPRQR